MAQRNYRVDRFAQMSKQEEIIAKKRQEILEKQRTAQLAKAVAAAQTLAAQLKTIETSTQAVTSTAIPMPVDEQEDEQDEDEHQPSPSPTTAVLTVPDEVNELDIDNGDQPAASSAKGKCDDGTPKTLNSFTGKTGKITFSLKRQQLPQPNVEQPPPKVKNTFCNDGSFLENFKKILEKHEQPKAPPIIVPPVPVPSDEKNTTDTHCVEDNNSPQQSMELAVSTITTSAAAVIATSMAGAITVSSTGHNHLAFSMPGTPTGLPQGVQPPPPPPFAFNPTMLAQGPPQMPQMAFFHGHHHHLPMQLHSAAVAPPPPPPPPQMPMTLANLTPIYMQLGPTQMPSEATLHQLNAIPAPKDFDLNAIPKPQMNLEAIQMPTNMTQVEQLGLLPEHVTVNPPPPPPPPMQQPEEQISQLQQQQQQQQQQHQQQQQQQQQLQQQLQVQQMQVQQMQKVHVQQLTPPTQVISETCIQLPTCIENLIALVAENGEDYEDKIRLHRSELHPALW